MTRQTIKACLWGASFFGVFTIFGDGAIKIIGILSILWMAVSTICTWIDEARQERNTYETQNNNNPYRLALHNSNRKYMGKE